MKIPERVLEGVRQWARRAAGDLAASGCPKDRAAETMRSQAFGPRDQTIGRAIAARNAVDVLRDETILTDTMSRMIGDAVNEVYGGREPC